VQDLIDHTKEYEDEISSLTEEVEAEKTDKENIKTKLDSRINELEENLSKVNKLNEQYKKDVRELQEKTRRNVG